MKAAEMEPEGIPMEGALVYFFVHWTAFLLLF